MVTPLCHRWYRPLARSALRPPAVPWRSNMLPRFPLAVHHST
uniref:Uncharacterized protein n=1 Tax=Arundo donax TaxID=35708 RepID=A0A0A9H5U6_ARUDO